MIWTTGVTSRCAALAVGLLLAAPASAREEHQLACGFDLFSEYYSGGGGPLGAAPVLGRNGNLVGGDYQILWDHEHYGPLEENARGIPERVDALAAQTGVNPAGQHIVVVYTRHYFWDPVESAGLGSFMAPFLRQVAPDADGVLDAFDLPIEFSYAFLESSAYCGFLASVLLHEALHAKLGGGVGFCTHMLIYESGVRQSCDKAWALVACKELGADEDRAAKGCPPSLDPDPDTGEPETDEDYDRRMDELVSGLCGGIANAREQLNDPERRAEIESCFCPPGVFENPCQAVAVVPGFACGTLDQVPPSTVSEGCAVCPEDGGGL